ASACATPSRPGNCRTGVRLSVAGGARPRRGSVDVVGRCTGWPRRVRPDVHTPAGGSHDREVPSFPMISVRARAGAGMLGLGMLSRALMVLLVLASGCDALDLEGPDQHCGELEPPYEELL